MGDRLVIENYISGLATTTVGNEKPLMLMSPSSPIKGDIVKIYCVCSSSTRNNHHDISTRTGIWQNIVASLPSAILIRAAGGLNDLWIDWLAG